MRASLLILAFIGLCFAGTCAAWWRNSRKFCRRDSECTVSKQCTCNRCGQKMPNTFRCSTNDNCVSGWCDGRHTYGCHGTCRSKVADHQHCRGLRDDNSCISGQCTCGICGRKMRNGLKCSTNDNCASGWCTSRGGTIGCRGICTAKLPDGAYSYACRRHNDPNSCATPQCTCGHCGRKMPSRYRCSTDDNCRSGNCRGWFTAGCRGRCK